MPSTPMHWLILLALAGLLAPAAVEDARARRLPNRLTAGVAALYPLHVLTSPAVVALTLAAASFAASAALFACRVLGGGDIKLIAAPGLWSASEHFPVVAAVIALSGGAVALACVWYERRGCSPLVPLLAAVAMRRGGPAAAAQGGGGRVPAGRVAGVPYGVAIVAGGLAVLPRLLGA